MALIGPRESNWYRKHKRLSLDGNTAGVPYARNHRGHHYATAPIGWGSQVHAEVYDPAHAFYQDMSAQYDAPGPWFEDIHVPWTPFIRLDPPQRPTLERSVEDKGLMTPQLMEEILQDLWEQESLGLPLDPTAVSNPFAPSAFMPNEPPDLSPELSVALPEPNTAYLAPEAFHEASIDLPEEELEVAESAIEASIGDPASLVLSEQDHGLYAEFGGLEDIVNDLTPDPIDHMSMQNDYGLPQMTHELFESTMQQAIDQPDPMQPMQQLYDDQFLQMMPNYIVPNGMMVPFGPMPGM